MDGIFFLKQVHVLYSLGVASMTLHARDPMCALAEKNIFNQSPGFRKPLWKPVALRGVSRVVSSNGISPAFVFPKSKY